MRLIDLENLEKFLIRRIDKLTEELRDVHIQMGECHQSTQDRKDRERERKEQQNEISR